MAGAVRVQPPGRWRARSWLQPGEEGRDGGGGLVRVGEEGGVGGALDDGRPGLGQQQFRPARATAGGDQGVVTAEEPQDGAADIRQGAAQVLVAQQVQTQGQGGRVGRGSQGQLVTQGAQGLAGGVAAADLEGQEAVQGPGGVREQAVVELVQGRLRPWPRASPWPARSAGWRSSGPARAPASGARRAAARATRPPRDQPSQTARWPGPPPDRRPPSATGSRAGRPVRRKGLLAVAGQLDAVLATSPGVRSAGSPSQTAAFMPQPWSRTRSGAAVARLGVDQLGEGSHGSCMR